MQNLRLVSSPPSVLMGIRDGVAGTRDTLKLMHALINEGKTNMAVRSQALALVKPLPPKARVLQVRVIFEFVRDAIRYVNDVEGVETLHTAEQVLRQGQGDCDDKVILLCAMLLSISHPCRIVAVRLNGAPEFSHVYAETRLGSRWVGMETTEQWPLGVVSPRITQRMIEHI